MSTIEEQLKALREETLASLKQITAENEKEMQDLRVSVLGKKGSLTEILKGMKDVSAEMRPIIGKHVNEARDVLTAAFEETAKLLEEKKVAAQLASKSFVVPQMCVLVSRSWWHFRELVSLTTTKSKKGKSVA